MRYFFDVETAPLPLDHLERIMPVFTAPKNIKDVAKMVQAITEKREEWLANAALKGTTGRVVAVTTAWDDHEPEFNCCPDERTMLDNVFHDFKEAIGLGANIYAWNGFGFDLPFLCQRMAAHGQPAYRWLLNNYKGRWSWHESFIDPMQLFAGPYQSYSGYGLDTVAKTLEVGAKTEHGADFAELLKTDPAKAKEYAVNDVEILRKVVLRMGI